MLWKRSLAVDVLSIIEYILAFNVLIGIELLSWVRRKYFVTMIIDYVGYVV